MAEGLLSRIGGPQDVKALPEGRLAELCDEIRRTLLDYGRRHGGHIGSNLGMVEATVALHRVFDSPRDRIVFDVSHQSYVHKMLTGRAAAYLDPALADSVTGFTNPAESEHDQFVLGHTGTSLSLACGLAKARDMAGQGGDVVAVIGDGSLSSGVAFEGLDNVAEQGGGIIVVFNDNEMSISGDFGGMYGPLARLRASGGTAEPNLFRAFGLDYRYVPDGNDVDALVRAFEEVRGARRPVVVHIHTVKGLGLPAGDGEDEGGTLSAAPGDGPADGCDLSDGHAHAGRCEASHWIAPETSTRAVDSRKWYGRMAMEALERRFPTEPGLVVVSPATPGSNGITRAFRARAGRHYVDTGITESHAVAFAAGVAKAGGTPVVATTASFFQRAYDQICQELAINGMPVTLLVFLGGLSGTDATHSGVADLAMLGSIPGLVGLAPASGRDFLHALDWATSPARRRSAHPGPVAIRVPGDPVLAADRAAGWTPSADGRADGDGAASPDPLRWRTVRQGSDVAVAGLGSMFPLARRVVETLDGRGTHATLIDPRCFSELDADALDGLRARHRLLVTLEDGLLDGGWGQRVAAHCANADAGDGPALRTLAVGAAREITDRVPVAELYERYGLTVESVTARIEERLA